MGLLRKPASLMVIYVVRNLPGRQDRQRSALVFSQSVFPRGSSPQAWEYEHAQARGLRDGCRVLLRGQGRAHPSGSFWGEKLQEWGGDLTLAIMGSPYHPLEAGPWHLGPRPKHAILAKVNFPWGGVPGLLRPKECRGAWARGWLTAGASGASSQWTPPPPPLRLATPRAIPFMPAGSEVLSNRLNCFFLSGPLFWLIASTNLPLVKMLIF